MSGLGWKIISIGSWLLFLGTWLTMLALLFIRWKVMSIDMRCDLLAILPLSGALWGRSAPEKGRELDRLLLSLATSIIYAFVHRLV